MRALLHDIAAGKIDVVVVYKVDRLTRALADFAKIVADRTHAHDCPPHSKPDHHQSGAEKMVNPGAKNGVDPL